MEETHRSLHDAIMIVRRAMKNDSVVAGNYNFSFVPIFRVLKNGYTNHFKSIQITFESSSLFFG